MRVWDRYVFSFHPLGSCPACTLYFSYIYLSSILFSDLAFSMNVFTAHPHPSSSGLSLFYVFCATPAKLSSGSKFGDLPTIDRSISNFTFCFFLLVQAIKSEKVTS
jgi:hypothetical protein